MGQEQKTRIRLVLEKTQIFGGWLDSSLSPAKIPENSNLWVMTRWLVLTLLECRRSHFMSDRESYLHPICMKSDGESNIESEAKTYTRRLKLRSHLSLWITRLIWWLTLRWLKAIFSVTVELCLDLNFAEPCLDFDFSTNGCNFSPAIAIWKVKV
jgi:hypothetical protein